jgi:predicted ArsR family transcriptional regulator
MDGVPGTDERAIEGIGVLAEPTRRLLYRFVVERDRAVSREEAAHHLGVPVHTAKFHLDRLVEAGLLDVEFHKLTGRTGPGSGRPSKHYRRAGEEIAVALPPRNYDLLSRLLADAIVEAARTGEPAIRTAGRVAYRQGHALGQRYRRPEPATRDDLHEALVDGGYEPHRGVDRTLLRNCPFHHAATRQTELVCGINRDYLAGLLDGLGCTGTRADLDPGAGRCCVTLTPAADRRSPPHS